MNDGALDREDLSALFVVSRRIGFCLGAIVAFDRLNDYLKLESDVADVELIRADDDRCVMGSIIALRRVRRISPARGPITPRQPKVNARHSSIN